MSFPQGVLHGLLRRKRGRCRNVTAKCCEKARFYGNKYEDSKKNLKRNPKRKKIALELMHQRLWHRSTRSLLAGDTANLWEDVELRIYPDPFCTSCKISSINKKAGYKLPLKPKAPFKWFFMDIIPSTAPKILTNDTNFSNYLLIVVVR